MDVGGWVCGANDIGACGCECTCFCESHTRMLYGANDRNFKSSFFLEIRGPCWDSSHTRTCTNTNKHTNTRTHKHTQIQPHTNRQTHRHTQTWPTPTHTRTHTDFGSLSSHGILSSRKTSVRLARPATWTHTDAPTTHTHTHTHVYTHTHRQTDRTSAH